MRFGVKKLSPSCEIVSDRLFRNIHLLDSERNNLSEYTFVCIKTTVNKLTCPLCSVEINDILFEKGVILVSHIVI